MMDDFSPSPGMEYVADEQRSGTHNKGSSEGDDGEHGDHNNNTGEPTLIQRAMRVGRRVFAMAEYIAKVVGWITMACIACAACYLAFRALSPEHVPDELVSHWPLDNFSYPIDETTIFGIWATLDDARSEIRRVERLLLQAPMPEAYTKPLGHVRKEFASGITRALETLSRLDQQPHDRLNENLSFARAELLQIESQANAHTEKMATITDKRPRPKLRKALLARGRALLAALQRVQHARMQFIASSDVLIVVQEFRYFTCQDYIPHPLRAVSRLSKLDLASISGAIDMVCKATVVVSERESRLRQKTSPNDLVRYSKRMANLIQKAEASMKILDSLERRPVTPEEAVHMDIMLSGVARNALTLIDEFYG